ncbi:fatty acid desaturase family protein [Kitasatospora sp. NPDC056181]|uniref:fatty acid desaturase family protein n=1 Tax=Kitasatospora sp. NPDC056181 TaxID=3345737 RepID=UPI0035D99C36
MRNVIGEAHRTRLAVSLALASSDHVSIPLAALVVAWPGWWSTVPTGAAGLLVGLAAVALTGRQLRGLECMLHEASHFNWSRHHRGVNDFCAGVLSCVPTGVRISRYRESHLVHHSRLGTADDPDRQRYQEYRIEGLDRSGPAVFSRGLVQRLYAYQRSWITETANDLFAVAAPVLWALLTIALPAALLWGGQAALTGCAVWLLGHVVALPVIRFVGESSEHSYGDADTVFDSTVTNLGPVQRWVFHPHSDGYHTVHHLWPGTPHHRLRSVHEALSAADPSGYAERLRTRHRVLSDPTPNRGAS